MPPWFPHVISCQKKEAKINSSRWVQLATIGRDNTPSVRTVVFRGWTESFEMKLFTDKRTEKFNELCFNNNVQICWFFSKTKCQFRFSGKSSVDLGEDTHQHWNQLDNHTKSMWNWPNQVDHYVIDQLKDISGNKKPVTPKNLIL